MKPLEQFLKNITIEHKNAEPIKAFLTPVFSAFLDEQRPKRSVSWLPRVVEWGAGSSEHAVYLTHHLAVAPEQPLLAQWVPTDLPGPNRTATFIVNKYKGLAPTRASSVLAAPVDVDSTSPRDWATLMQVEENGKFDVCFSCCVMHQMSWPSVVKSLANITGDVLSESPGSLFIVYGPFRHQGKYLAEYDETFDMYLRRLNPACSMREADDLVRECNRYGLALTGCLKVNDELNRVASMFIFQRF